MTYLEFIFDLKNRMELLFPNLEFSVQETRNGKNSSDMNLTAKWPGREPVSVLNMQNAYKAYLRNENIGKTVKNLSDLISTLNAHRLNISEAEIRNYERMKDRLVVELHSVNDHSLNLKNQPFKRIGDMILVYRLELSCADQSTAYIPVTNGMLAHYGITAEELHKDAIASSQKLMPGCLMTMEEKLFEQTGTKQSDVGNPFFFATVKGSKTGASAICYPDFLREAAEKIDGSFYIFPASVSECFLFKDNGQAKGSLFNQMLKSYNKTSASPAERLSDMTYHYDAEKKLLETALQYENRTMGKAAANLSANTSRRQLSRCTSR